MAAGTAAGARFRPSETVDFAIVGSGAAGGIIAKELSTAGFSVVVLEQGPRLHRGAVRPRRVRHLHAEPQRATTRRRSRRRSGPRRRTRRRKALALIYGRLVGGSNAHFTGNFWRLRPSDFNEASVLGGVPGHGARGLADHLRRARAVLHEGRMGAGRVGRAGTVRSAAVAPLSDAAAAGEVVGRADRRAARGRSGFTRSRRRWRSTRSPTTAGRPASTAASACSSCASSGAKSTSMATMLPIAEATGRCEIRPDSYVARVETGSRRPRHRASRTSTRSKQLQLQRARAVVLCANGGRNAAAAAQLGVAALSERPRQLERRSSAST